MKRILSLILALLMLCGLAGCERSGGNDTAPESTPISETPSSETESITELPQTEEETEPGELLIPPSPSAVLGEPSFVGAVCGNGTAVASNIAQEVSKYNASHSSALRAPSVYSDSTASVYKNMTKAKYDSYIQELLANGCEIITENEIGKVYFTTIKANPNRLMTVYFVTAQKQIRVIDEPYHEIDTILPSPENAPSDCQTSIITMPLTADHEQSCFVITLSDGRLVLFDTGYTNVLDAPEGLINTLKEYSYYYNNTTEKKIKIAAIYISHLHDDHYGGLVSLANKYSDIVEVERVYANFPSTEKENYWDDPLEVEDCAKKVMNAAKKLGAEFVFVRSGQKVRIADADFEVMYTPDDLGDYEIRRNDDGSKNTSRDINNTCLYVRMTVKGKTAIFCGDSRQGQTELVCKMYLLGLKCDILAVAHHGYNASGSKELYTTYGKPTVLLWTNTKAILAATTSNRSFIDALQKLSTVTEHVYPTNTKRAVYVIE